MKRGMAIGFAIGVVIAVAPALLWVVGIELETLGIAIWIPGAIIGASVGLDTPHGGSTAELLLLNSLFWGSLGSFLGYIWSIRRTDGSARSEQTCAKCGHCLIGNKSGICPECGTRIDQIGIRA